MYFVSVVICVTVLLNGNPLPGMDHALSAAFVWNVL